VLSADARSAGYGYSFVNGELYCRYDRAHFVETLTEWGYTGPIERRPRWMEVPTALGED
jgi:hypothetical protein